MLGKGRKPVTLHIEHVSIRDPVTDADVLCCCKSLVWKQEWWERAGFSTRDHHPGCTCDATCGNLLHLPREVCDCPCHDDTIQYVVRDLRLNDEAKAPQKKGLDYDTSSLYGRSNLKTNTKISESIIFRQATWLLLSLMCPSNALQKKLRNQNKVRSVMD